MDRMGGENRVLESIVVEFVAAVVEVAVAGRKALVPIVVETVELRGVFQKSDYHKNQVAEGVSLRVGFELLLKK